MSLRGVLRQMAFCALLLVYGSSIVVDIATALPVSAAELKGDPMERQVKPGKSASNDQDTPGSGRKLRASTATPSEFGNMLAAHNERRARHGVGPLTWNSNLATHSQYWANQLPCSQLSHGVATDPGSASNLGEGENLYAYGYSIATPELKQATIDAAVVGWYDNEIPLYNYQQPGFSLATGHFTQLVWASTTQVGCAVTQTACSSGGLYWHTISCRYSPPGNYMGEFETNVPPLLTGR